MIAAELFRVSSILQITAALLRHQTNEINDLLDQIILDSNTYPSKDESAAAVQSEQFRIPSVPCILAAMSPTSTNLCLGESSQDLDNCRSTYTYITESSSPALVTNYCFQSVSLSFPHSLHHF